MRGLLIALLVLCAGEARALDDTSKKLCAVIAGQQLPTLPGLAITKVTVADDAPTGEQAVKVVAESGGGYPWARTLSDKYGLFNVQQMRLMSDAAGQGKRDLVIQTIHTELKLYRQEAAMVELAFKAGAIEGAYGFACVMIRNQGLVVGTGLAR